MNVCSSQIPSEVLSPIILDLPKKSLDEETKLKKRASLEKDDLLVKNIYQGIHRDWEHKHVSMQLAFNKMKKNLFKALLEHRNAYDDYITRNSLPLIKNPYIDLDTLKSFQNLTYPFDEIKEAPPDTKNRLTLSMGCTATQGKRNYMEDVYFTKALPEGQLISLFDGHGSKKMGKQVADYACFTFKDIFPSILIDCKGNVHQAFEETCFQIQEQIKLHKEFNSGGSTAVICYVAINSKVIYTATIGDSKANIYMEIDGELLSIPVSCVRNWASARDELRAAVATEGDYEIPVLDFWNNSVNNHNNDNSKRNGGKVPAKHRRIAEKKSTLLVNDELGVNVSRCFGDQSKNIDRLEKPIVCKPKISSFEIPYIPPNSIFLLVIGSDGLWDFLEDENEVIKRVKNSFDQTPKKISEQLVDLALEKQSVDNITVIAVKITNPIFSPIPLPRSLAQPSEQPSSDLI